MEAYVRINRVIAAVMPLENEEFRREARAKAREAARPGDGVPMTLTHHEDIEAAPAAVTNQTTAMRFAALDELSFIHTGHLKAEESVLYPALAVANEKGVATIAYKRQASARSRWRSWTFWAYVGRSFR